MAWIESHQELAAHPKMLRLAKVLGDSVPAVIGRIHLLWWWALSYAPDGDLSRFDDDEIATPMRWEGDPAVLRRSLIEVGFVNPDGSLHDWHEYAGRLVEQRALTREQRASGGRNRMAQLAPEERSMLAKQAAEARWMPGQLAPPSINMPATVPNRTGQDRTGPNRTVPNQPIITQDKSKEEVGGPGLPTASLSETVEKKVKSTPRRAVGVTPEYLTEMVNEFPTLNVDRIYRLKFSPWCKQHQKQETQRRFVDWLEKDAKDEALRKADGNGTREDTTVSGRKPDTEDGSDDPRWTVIRSGRNQAPDGDDG